MTMPRDLDEVTRDKLRELAQRNLAARDDLYTAAEVLDDHARKQVCRRLAEDLAGHVAELEQIVVANGGQPISAEDLAQVAEEVLFGCINVRSTPAVLTTAEQSERGVEKAYDAAIEEIDNVNAKGILKREREDVVFGKRVLQSMQHPPKRESSGEERGR